MARSHQESDGAKVPKGWALMLRAMHRQPTDGLRPFFTPCDHYPTQDHQGAPTRAVMFWFNGPTHHFDAERREWYCIRLVAGRPASDPPVRGYATSADYLSEPRNVRP